MSEMRKWEKGEISCEPPIMRPLRQIRPLFLVDEPRSKTIFSHHCGKIYGIRFITNITIVIAIVDIVGIIFVVLLFCSFGAFLLAKDVSVEGPFLCHNR